MCQAAQSLLNGQCDIALAGGVNIRLPQEAGYVYQPEGIYSPDGHCRAFDASACGTVFGNGVGAVVLRRLNDALEAGDNIRAVIKGFAINNDGSLKVGYTAPGLEGQAEVISAALAMAGINPDTIGYVETHGTGTALGDPIEIEALTQAFKNGPIKKLCVRSRLGQNEHRPSRSGSGRGEPDQGGAGFAKPGDPTKPALYETESAHQFRRRSVFRERSP